jgi:inorganic pyrophosphatase
MSVPLRLAVAAIFVTVCGARAQAPVIGEVADPETHVLIGARSFVAGYEARNKDGSVNVVVEIPTGTTAKWEVQEDGRMVWELRAGEPRVVKYLGYPGNYGMIPRTLAGDDDPLDVIVLGPAVRRGSVVRANLLGVMKFLDDGERDDKLLAVLEGDPLSTAQDIEDLEGGKLVHDAVVKAL